MEDRKTRIFKKEELEELIGKGGKPQYLAFKGKVYDISNSRLWKEGLHLSGIHNLNENLEEKIKGAPHGEEVISRFPLVGELEPTQRLVPTQAPVPLKAEVPSIKTEEILSAEDQKRRDFLKIVLTAGGVATVLALGSSLKFLAQLPQLTTKVSWPRLKVTNIKSISSLSPIMFNYPLVNTPNLLVKLGVKADNGVGPDGDIVAYSGICQHLGCYYGFQAPGSSPQCNSSYKVPVAEGYCCCHGSQYDFAHSGKVIGGPSPRPVPQVNLEYDQATGDIYAVSMGPPNIFGHGPPGATDPATVLQYDLQGGDAVST